MANIIPYSPYNSIDDAESLKAWAKENIVDAYISSLDDDYYDTGMTGWQALFDYIVYEEDYEKSMLNESVFLTEEALYKLIRYENHRLNSSDKDSGMDEHFNKGYYGYESVEESAEHKEFVYTITVNEVELDYPKSDIYPVEHLDYPKEIKLKFSRDDIGFEELYRAVAEEVEDKMDYGIDAPDAVDDVMIGFVDFDVVSIE